MGILGTILKKLYTGAKWGALFFWLMYIDGRHFSFMEPTLTLIGDGLGCIVGEGCYISKDVNFRARGGGVFDDGEWMKHRPNRTTRR